MKINLKFTWKIWLLIIILVLSLLSIFATPYLFQKGVVISSVTTNSTAAIQGFNSSSVINSINGQPVTNTTDYANIIQNIFVSNNTVKVTFNTNQGSIIYYSNSSPDITAQIFLQQDFKLVWIFLEEQVL